MPFTETMLYCAAKAIVSGIGQKKRDSVDIEEVFGSLGAYAHVGLPLTRRCFVVKEEGVMSDVEMVKCENCEMWYQSGTVCQCMWLPPSSLSKAEDEEPAYEAELVEPEQEEMVPCICLRVINMRQRQAYGTKFTCTLCKGKLVIPKERA